MVLQVTIKHPKQISTFSAIYRLVEGSKRGELFSHKKGGNL